MTHYDISYEGMTPQDAHAKALRDIEDYMGTDRFITLTRVLREYPPQSIAAFHLQMSLAGVQGYPVRAYHDHIWPYG